MEKDNLFQNNGLYFISMEGKRDYYINNFLVREDIPLPISIEEGKQINLNDITPENIIAGMIKVLIKEPDNEHLDYYRKFLFTIQPDIETRLANIAYEAEKRENFSEAISLFKVIYSLKPDSLNSILNLAVCYDEFSQYLYKRGRDKEAIKMEEIAYDYYKSVDSFEEKPENALYYLGRFYTIRENYEKAIEYFRDFLKITKDKERKDDVIKLLEDIKNSGITDDDYKLARELIESDKDSEAVEFINKYLKKYPKSWHGYYLKGIVYRKTEDYTKALNYFNMALKYNPDSSEIFNEIGLCYMNLNIFYKSEMFFEKALKKNPDDISIISNLALLSYKKGNKEEAIKYCDVILELFPQDLEAQKLKKFFLEEKNET